MEKIVFMGSPDFVVPTLDALAKNYQVAGVVTQPDKPAGRGRKLVAPPVKLKAEALGIPVIQPGSLKGDDVIKQLAAWAPDVIVVAAYGKILRQNVLGLPKFGCINVHASLLPRWRGASPIRAAILHGDEKSGVSIMQMEAGLDTGPVLGMRETAILPEDTGGSLTERLAVMGAELLIEILPAYLSGGITPLPQDDHYATYAPMIKKQEGELDFSNDVEDLSRKIRAFQPWPGTFMDWEGGRLKVLAGYVVGAAGLETGQRSKIEKKPAIAAKGGWLVLDEVQPAGKKPMSGKVFLNGARDWINTEGNA